ncbi:hypothetical protein BDR05DRAFT_959792 [Suillus weaverae]|nr:hypothetical protein BDR05DRAFT_959792 [Suillus weaverae]
MCSIQSSLHHLVNVSFKPNLPNPERILYAALAPCPQTFSVLKSACRTWEDHLSAQISILCEEKQTAEMIKLGGGFWDGGFAVLENMPSPPSQEEDAAEEEEWEREATSTLETLGSVHVEGGPTADHAFHVSQLAIILDRTSSLLETFATGLRDGNFDPESSEYPTMTRFFAHLCLYLRMIDITVPPLATQVILEAYLQVLEAAGQRELIAIRAICDVLASLELTADVNERRLALTHVHMVAVVTAERTIDRAFELLPKMKGPLPSVIALQATPSDTTFEDGTHDTALEQATVILRYFLGAGRVSLAKNLVEMLPRELASIDQPEERATEYLHYRQFFTIWDSLDRVVECQSLEVSIMNRDTRAAWLSDYTGLMDQAYDVIVKLLTSDWMMLDETGDRRSRELTRVRQIYVPELILRLHVVLYASREHVPENLKRALKLANIVADSRYELYDDFLHLDGRRLGEYLDAVRRATIAGLEGGGSDPFKVIMP